MDKENEISHLKNRPLERIFQNSISRILDFFIFNQNFNFSTTEISELGDIPLRTVQRILPQLVEKEIIKEIKINKKNKTYELNKNSELVEILDKYSIVTINSFIKDALVEEEEKNKNIINLNRIVDDFT
jgi:Fe2+ or Zn2+ uptake regulation protein